MSGSHRQHRDNPNYKSKMQLNNMNKFETFESYLEDCAVEDSPETMGGGSDGQQEGTERWIENLDASDVMEYAEAYGKKMYEVGKSEGHGDGFTTGMKHGIETATKIQEVVFNSVFKKN